MAYNEMRQFWWLISIKQTKRKHINNTSHRVLANRYQYECKNNEFILNFGANISANRFFSLVIKIWWLKNWWSDYWWSKVNFSYYVKISEFYLWPLNGIDSRVSIKRKVVEYLVNTLNLTLSELFEYSFKSPNY